MAEDLTEKISRYCNVCRRLCEHTSVLCEEGCLQTQTPDRADEVVFHRSDVFKCTSCGFLSLRFFGIQAGGPEVEAWYPPAMVRRRPPWWHELPNSATRQLLAEVYSAVVHDSTRLAAMGIRALIEQVAIERAGAPSNSSFSDKVNALIKKGLVAAHSRPALQAALELGHAATHRGHRPHIAPLVQCLDVIENMLETIYILPEASREINICTPKRKK